MTAAEMNMLALLAVLLLILCIYEFIRTANPVTHFKKDCERVIEDIETAYDFDYEEYKAIIGYIRNLYHTRIDHEMYINGIKKLEESLTLRAYQERTKNLRLA